MNTDTSWGRDNGGREDKMKKPGEKDPSHEIIFI
jgi:hypothetical protein